jgi:hypothetical protein
VTAKPYIVKDPRGVVWYLGLTHEIVKTASLERAIERSTMTEREKRKARKQMGVGNPLGSALRLNLKVGWGREHSYSWVMHATSNGDHRAWISPARHKTGALADLDGLAAQIKLGEEPRPSHP